MKRPHLYKLARSPLLLTLIAQVDSSGSGSTLPNDRAGLYEKMVELLLARWENRLDQDTHMGVEGDRVLSLGVPTEELRTVLARLAYKGHQAQGEEQSGQGSQGSKEAASQVAEISYADLHMALINQFETKERVDQIITYISQRTGLLVEHESNATFAFPHRTYQEYLAARYLIQRSDGQKLLCQKLEEQPDWWKEVFLLSAGSSMKTPVYVQNLLNELLPNEPEKENVSSKATLIMIAAQALSETDFRAHVEQEQRAGGYTVIYHRIQTWLQISMSADKQVSTDVRIEAADWLAKLGDNRHGAGINPQTGWPDIAWGGVVPAGTYEIGGDRNAYDSFDKGTKARIEKEFALAKYPVTNGQFQAFIDDTKGQDDADWWQGIPENEKKFADSRWPHANRPRTNVSWYQATAFCRWLSQKLKEEIYLPNEYEWETAAHWGGEGTDGPHSFEGASRFYPYGNQFDKEKANTDESGIGQTTAVGLYPSGKNEALDLYDMSGNVWEWCRNKYQPDKNWRVLRGGSFGGNRSNARAAGRSSDSPDYRDYFLGFRVAVVRRSPSHQGH